MSICELQCPNSQRNIISFGLTCQRSYVCKTITNLFMLKYFIIILTMYLVFTSNSQLSDHTKQAILLLVQNWEDRSVIPWLETLFCVDCCRNINKLIVGAWLEIYSFGTDSSQGGQKKSRSNLEVWQEKEWTNYTAKRNK